MREILITILILSCFSTFTSAERGSFEFHDSYGRCWRCLPGSACVRCSTIFVPFVSGPPDPWDRTCEQPTVEICNEHPGVKFPHQDIGFYWICADDDIIVEAPCFCDQVFDMRQQECVKTNNLTTIACNEYANPDPHDCASDYPRPPASTLSPGVTTPSTIDPGVTTPSVPTAPNEPTTTTGSTTTTKTIWVSTAPNETPTIPTQPPTTTTNIYVPTAPTDPNAPTTIPPIWVPTAPNEPTTTTTSNGITDPITTPTRTTEIGGPGVTNPGTTTTVTSNTTPAPCVCVVWWPCWCNPCWNMPCHSCNGCVGMMG